MSKETSKEYLALVRGPTQEESWQVKGQLTNHDKGKKQDAWSEFRLLKTFWLAENKTSSLVRAWLRTGRRHQLRRHLSSCHNQILGDSTYGKGRINRYYREHFTLPRMFLHAVRLRMQHPETGQVLRLLAPLPADLRKVVAQLSVECID
jgi:tRNA pseudouridine65 synthase